MQSETIGAYGAALRVRPGRLGERGEAGLDGERWGEPPRVRERRRRVERRAKVIGLVSLGLGIAAIVAPGIASRLVGARRSARSRGAVLAVGAREIVSGVGVLARRSPSWMFARALGDVLDLALLGRATRSRKANRAKLLASMGSVLGVLALDVATGIQLRRVRAPRLAREGIHVTRSITVGEPLEVVYTLFANLQNVPRFMSHLASVVKEGRRSRWRRAAPRGAILEWDVEMIEDRACESVAWRSLDGGHVEAAGRACFAPARGGRATAVTVDVHYVPKRRRAARMLASLFGKDPGTRLDRDLRHFKQLVEVGEILHSDASIHEGKHPARPPTAEELEAMR